MADDNDGDVGFSEATTKYPKEIELSQISLSSIMFPFMGASVATGNFSE